MKKGLVVIALLCICISVQAIKVQGVDITVRIDSQGNAVVAENYALQFSSPFEFEDFKNTVRDNSASLFAWQADYDFFYPHFAGISGNNLSSSSITFDEASKVLSLEYSLADRFARLVKQEQRTDVYKVEDNRWAAFNESGIIVIPENTAIRIIVPQNAQINSQLLPEKVQLVNNSQALLRGLQSNSITIQYSIFKPIASNNLIPGIADIYLAIPILALALVAIYVRREKIEKQIEDYLVKHSEIKSRPQEEDFVLEIEK
ncbi:MAG TPA: hypothetical protein HA254_07450 [Candidatus Diapherotrites archaeon]|uniref:Uncharacterized protein n=1 Tax=Candidatus Iainarchaeum sp. TaxID=3101447 RepID=A0A7J4IY76_9ARCH|nr:hypothetical protein [Candidatus Diapherotrites archaeon]